MSRRRRPVLHADAQRTLRQPMLREGQKLRRARKRRHWTQAQLGAKVGLSQSTISKMELGQGSALSVEIWQRVALVLGVELTFQLGRDVLDEPRDAGHLAMQELVLRLGRAAGYGRAFELQTRASDPARWTDVNLRDDVHRRLLRVECVNVFGDIGAAARSSDLKGAEAEAYAIAIGQGEPYSVHACWVVRATRRNRELLARYPEMFATRFPGSSAGWVRALAAGGPPPGQPGLVWCDVGATRILEWRPRRRPAASGASHAGRA